MGGLQKAGPARKMRCIRTPTWCSVRTIRCFACFRRELTPAWPVERHNDAL